MRAGRVRDTGATRNGNPRADRTGVPSGVTSAAPERPSAGRACARPPCGPRIETPLELDAKNRPDRRLLELVEVEVPGARGRAPDLRLDAEGELRAAELHAEGRAHRKERVRLRAEVRMDRPVA